MHGSHKLASLWLKAAASILTRTWPSWRAGTSLYSSTASNLCKPLWSFAFRRTIALERWGMLGRVIGKVVLSCFPKQGFKSYLPVTSRHPGVYGEHDYGPQVWVAIRKTPSQIGSDGHFQARRSSPNRGRIPPFSPACPACRIQVGRTALVLGMSRN